MDLRIHIVAVASAVLLFSLVFELVRRRRLMERYALLWLLAATTLLVLAVWKDLLNLFARVVGIAYPPNALFLVALAFVLLMLLHFSLVISALHDQSKVLAQRVGMLQQRLDEVDLAREVDAIAAPAPERELTSPTRET